MKFAFCSLLVLIMFLTIPMKGMAQTSFTGGTGEEGSPYLITTEAQLKEIAKGLDKHYKLTKDIPLTETWSPINNFTGSLEGDGFKITNLTIKTTSNAGLFDANKGTITNLGVAVASIKGKTYVGAIAGVNNGVITNCFVTGGTITADNGWGSVGGIAGSNDKTISNCYVALDLVQITSETGGKYNFNLGGIAGMSAAGSVKYCLVANKEMSVEGATGMKFSNYIVGGDRAAQEFSADNKLNFFSYKVLRTGIFFSMSNPSDPRGMTGLLWPGSFPADDACNWAVNEAGTFYLKGTADKPIGAIDLSAHIYLDGKGTTDAPYQIKDEAGLIKLRDYVNGTGSREADRHYALIDHITMSDTPFRPIGKTRAGGYDGDFRGTFDGDGHSIKNLKLDNSETNTIGLFKTIGEGAVIKNLAVTDCNIDIENDGSNGLDLGPITGTTSNATIDNCYTTGTIKVTSTKDVHMGGIAGDCNCVITNCYSDVDITVDVQAKSNISYIGGITGNTINNGSVTNCFAKGTIEVKGIDMGSYCGGILGGYDGKPAQKCLALNPSIKSVTASNDANYVSQIAVKGYWQVLNPNNGNYAFLKMELFKNDASYKPVSDTEELGEGDGKKEIIEEDAAGWRGELPSDAWEKTDDGYVNLISIAETFGLKEQVKLSDYMPFAITLSETIANGTLTADPAEAFSGDKVTITVTPNPGYKLIESSLKYNDTQIVAVDDVYSFIMPSEAVTLSATFELDSLKLNDITIGDSLLISQEADKTWWYEVKTVETETKALRLVDSKIPFNGIITGTLTDNKALVMSATCQSEITCTDVTVSTFIIEEGAAVVLSSASKLTYTTAKNNGGSLVAKSGAEIADGTGETIKTSAVTFDEPENGTFIVQVGNTELASGDMVTEGSKFTVTATPAGGYELSTLTVKPVVGTALTPDAAGAYTMPGEAITVSATFESTYVPPVPTPTYYTVTLPAVIGATTHPAAGTHEVEEWSNFSFALTLDPGYSESIPVVTANGETITPRSSDGKYVVRSVREDMTISITGITPNIPTGNDQIEAGTRIYAADGTLYITVDQPTEAQIVTFGGSVLRSLHLPAGQTTISDIIQGFYIVRLSNGTSQKVKL